VQEPRQMRQELNTLSAAITSKRQHLDDHGLFDAQARAAATDLDVPDGSSPSGLEPLPHSQSLIAKEIDALGERFRLWLSRVDRKYHSNYMRE